MGHQLKISVFASELAKWCDLSIFGSDLQILGISPLSSAADGMLSFAKSTPSDVLPDRAILIGSRECSSFASCLLVAENPRLAFAKVLDQLDRRIGFVRPESPPTIHPSAMVSPQAYLGPGVIIGARTVVHPFAFIGEGTRIGADCIIKAGAVLGQDGFGFERDEQGLPLRLVHLGSVILGDNVEVGSLATVCRGTLNDTIIEDHAKVDDHVHVAHNVHIGVGAMVIACAELSGGVILGKGSWIGPNASIIQQRRIGEGAMVGIGANVLKDVPDGITVVGNPAKPLNSK